MVVLSTLTILFQEMRITELQLDLKPAPLMNIQVSQQDQRRPTHFWNMHEVLHFLTPSHLLESKLWLAVLQVRHSHRLGREGPETDVLVRLCLS